MRVFPCFGSGTRWMHTTGRSSRAFRKVNRPSSSSSSISVPSTAAQNEAAFAVSTASIVRKRKLASGHRQPPTSSSAICAYTTL